MSKRSKDQGASSGELFSPADLMAGRQVQGFLIDVEGTLVRSERAARAYEALPGAAGLLDALEARGLPFVVMTDSTMWTPQETARRLRAAGLPVADSQALTPASVAADQLARAGVRRALVLGLDGVGRPLEEAGVEVVRPGDPRADEVEAVFVGWHPDGDMADIEAGARAVWAGARLYTASDAPFVQTREGRGLGYAHALTAAIRAATGASATLVGKPSPAAFAHAARLLDAPAPEIAVVGDDPEVDIAMAKRAGAVSIAVCTDAVDRDDWASVPPGLVPDALFDRVGEAAGMLDAICG